MLTDTATAKGESGSEQSAQRDAPPPGTGIILQKQLSMERSKDTRERIALRDPWVAVRYEHVPDDSARRRLRGRWVRVSAKCDGGRPVYRVLRFAGRDFAAGHIGLDWEGWLDLVGPKADSAEITIRKARFHELPLAMLSHPDPAQRASYLVALVALVLGILSVVLALAV